MSAAGALAPVLAHLEQLVSYDTRNPPRSIGTDGIVRYLVDALPGFRITVSDHGAGAISVLAVRGAPTRVFNFHIDTVPVAEGWRRDPHRLSVEDDRAYGLGSCDIKGASAAMLDAAACTSGPLALLFSSDEEANDPRCIAGFLRTDHGFDEAIVAEPTGCRARLAHRGILALHAVFRGVPGHASEARALDDSAIHRAIAWSTKALEFARQHRDARFDELVGLPFNIGRIDGGVKGNVIAGRCEARISVRPLPSMALDELAERFRGFADPATVESFDVSFRGPTLPARSGDPGAAQLAAGAALAARLGLEVGPAVNFWTEASLFSDAGMTALVFGPGDIAQAHTADEWVALAELQSLRAHYARLIDGVE